MAEHLVRGREQEVAYWAFVPPPLPRQPPRCLDWSDVRLRRALSDADLTLGELAGLGRTIPNPHLLIAPFVRVRRCFHHGSRGRAQGSGMCTRTRRGS